MNQERAEKIAEEYFDAYTIDHRIFQDGDERWLIVHNLGWGEGDYVTITIWLTKDTVQVEWFEDDRRFSMEWIDFQHWERGDIFGRYRKT